jgi:hypothetical protein
MEPDNGGTGNGSDPDTSRTAKIRGKNYGESPYLDKEGREILNRASRAVKRERPEWVDDPDDPKLSDVLVYLQQGRNGFTDQGIIIDLLGKGLTAEETLVWILHQHSSLKPREIFYAYEGKDHPGCEGVDEQAVRNVESRIRSAARKLGVNADV